MWSHIFSHYMRGENNTKKKGRGEKRSPRHPAGGEYVWTLGDKGYFAKGKGELIVSAGIVESFYKRKGGNSRFWRAKKGNGIASRSLD